MRLVVDQDKISGLAADELELGSVTARYCDDASADHFKRSGAEAERRYRCGT